MDHQNSVNFQKEKFDPSKDYQIHYFAHKLGYFVFGFLIICFLGGIHMNAHGEDVKVLPLVSSAVK